MKRLGLFFALLLIPLVSCGQTPPQSLQDFTVEEWETETDDVIVYWTASGDTAWVHDSADGAYWRARTSGTNTEWHYRCPTQDQALNLSAVQSKLDSVDTSLSDLVTGGSTTPYPSVQQELNCFEDYWTSLDTLLSTADTVTFETPGEITYAKDCFTSVDNSTYYVADAGMLDMGAGDTLGIVTKEGRCAGYGTPNDDGQLVFAGAAYSEISEQITGQKGIRNGAPVALHIFRESSGTFETYRPQYRDCDSVDAPMCGAGGFEKGRWYEIESASKVYVN